MKKLLAIGACVLATLSAYAQGTVTLVNRVSGVFDAPIFDVNGTTRLDGAAFVAQLFAGPAGSAEGALTAVGDPSAFRSGAAAGYFTAADRTITGIPAGGAAVVQVRAFEAAAATYANAIATGRKFGKSGLINLTATGNPTAAPPGSPVLLGGFPGGLTSFNLVPEPSTIALGVLGAAALLLRRRKA